MKNQKISLSFISIIIALFFLSPVTSFGAACYSNIGTPMLETKADGSCPTGTYLTDPCIANPVPGCTNYVAKPSPSQGTSATLGGSQPAVTGPISAPALSDKGSGFIPSDAAIKASGFTAAAGMLNTIINWFIAMSVAIATVTFSIAGAKILMHPDDSGQITEAKEMAQKTFIGMLLVVGAWLIINTIVSTLVSNPSSALRFLSK